MIASGSPTDDAFLLASDDSLAGFFEEAVRGHDNAESAVANWVINELRSASEGHRRWSRCR